MFLTVILSILAITTAIRVPTAWPDYQDQQIQDLHTDQDTHVLSVPRNSFQTLVHHQAEQPLNQPNTKGFYVQNPDQQSATAAGYVNAQYPRRPSGSHAKNLIENHHKPIHTPDVAYNYHEPHSPINNKRPLTSSASYANALTNNNSKPRAHYHQKPRHDNPKSAAFSQPVVYSSRNVNFPTFSDGWTPITGQNSRHKILQRNNIYTRHNNDRQNNKISKKPARSPPPQTNPHHTYINHDKVPRASKYQHHPVLVKNYRDDQTHETPEDDHEAERLDEAENEDLQNENDHEEDQEEKLPVSDYETHNDVPTKPIYPGEGLWATPELKHRPFISKHQHTGLSRDNQEKPEGYETFESAAPTFERERSKYAEKIHSFPQITPKPYLKYDQHEESTDEDHEEIREDDEEVEDDEEDGFVPTKLLAQVRKTENEEHLSSNPEDGRLKEVIKDSKIHTVYTEEGYEDIAYDHAGQEKNAEDSEGHAEFDKDALKLKNKNPKGKKSKSTETAEANILREFENYNDPSKKHIESFDDHDESSDAEGSESSYEAPMLSTKNFALTNENITTEIKDMQDDDMQLEITSEVKIMTQPNNVSTAHKFVKIIPKKHEPSSSNSSEATTRTKRSVVDLHKIQVSQDFLDVFNAEKPQPTRPPPTPTEKYPYYEIRNSELLHKNSPLRYAEDMKNIPKKIPGRMTFYEQSRVSECPDIPRNVNPIPDRVEEAHQKHQQPEEGGQNGGPAELPDVPRLRNLGDKIDCLKIKLFGENPLDSPIFQESFIEAPESIFKELDSINDVVKNNNFKQVGHESPKAHQILNEAAQISQGLIEQAGHDQDDEENAELEEEEDGEELEEPYSASDTNEEYADNDADYQTIAQTTEEAPLTTTTIKIKSSEKPVATSTPRKTPVTKPLEHVFRITDRPPTTTQTISTTQQETNANFFPRHIYDQIDFSQDLEMETITPEVSTTKPSSSEATLQDQIVQTTEKLLPSTAIPEPNLKHLDDLLDVPQAIDSQNDLNATITDVEDAKLIIHVDEPLLNSKPNLHNNQQRKPKSFDVILPSELGNENATTRRMDAEEILPESSALRLQQRRRQRPQRPSYHVFDVNRFLPTPLPPIGHQLTYPITKPIKTPALPQYKVFDITKFLPTPIPALVPYLTPNTQPPKYKTLSEVYYKDEIKPNEQLNVFADVINNIKNSPPETLQAEGSEHFPTVQDIQEPPKHHGKMKVPSRKIRMKPRATTPTTTTTTTTSTTASPRNRRKNKHKNHKTNAQIYEEYLSAIKSNDQDTKTPPPTKSSIAEDQSQFTPIISQDLSSVDEVVGLAPPFSGFDIPVVYTLNNKNPFANHQQLTESTTLNTFLVPGMKPPGKHTPLLYSDFRLVSHNRVRRKNNYHRIQKRSPGPYKPSYSEIRRGKPAQASKEEEEEEIQEEKKEQEVEEEDDYVPKRNRNFHYDVETRKVVYDDKKEDQEEDVVAEPQEEELSEEDEDDYLPLIKVTPKPPKPKFVVVTTERNGPSFLEYVQQLKNNTEYKVIHDPTKKPPEEPTTKSDLKEVESTTKQADAVIPQFLSIVSKLKSNDDYKDIRDKKDKPTTTTAAPEEEVEEIEEPDLEVRNSPGGSQGSIGYDRSQIFDINEYLPQVKNYSPKTVIDYSKYKTIQRAPVATRHNLSSRYNSDEDDLVVNTRRTTEAPIVAASEDSAEASSFKHVDESKTHRRTGYTSSEELREKVERTTTTTTTEPTTTKPTTTTQPIRIRMRGRKRPTTTTSAPTTTSSTEPTTKRRTRVRSRPTTTTESPLEANHSQPQRVVHRRRPIERYTRHNQNVPPNHKPLYTPLSVEEQVDSKPVVQRKRKVSRLVPPNHVQLPEKPSNETLEEDSGKVGEIQSRKLDDVQVFRKYDPSKKHGGNYRREDQDSVPQAVEANSAPPTAYEIEDSKEIRRLSDVVPKPFAFYSDPTLPGSVNQLKEPKATVEDLSTESGEVEPTASVEGRTDKDYVDYEDEVRINFRKNSETATTNSVYIVKDPSKRLYYYAPV